MQEIEGHEWSAKMAIFGETQKTDWQNFVRDLLCPVWQRQLPSVFGHGDCTCCSTPVLRKSFLSNFRKICLDHQKTLN